MKSPKQELRAVLDIPQGVIETVALLSLTHLTEKGLAEASGLTVYEIREIKKKEEFSKFQEKLSDELLRKARVRFKGSVAALAEKMVEVLVQALEKGDLEAVKLGIKIYGLDQEDKSTQTAPIQVFLPGSRPKEKDIPHDPSSPHLR